MTETSERDAGTGCLIHLVLFVLVLAAWGSRCVMCTSYNDSIIGVMGGFFLIPAATQVGAACAGLLTAVQVGWHAIAILWRWTRQKLTAVPRRLLKRSTDEDIDIFSELNDRVAFSAIFVAFLVGAAATASGASFLLGLGSGAADVEMWERALIVKGYHTVASVIFAGAMTS